MTYTQTRKQDIKPGEGRLSGQIDFGRLIPLEKYLKQIAYKFNLDLRIDSLSSGWITKSVYFVFEGKELDIIKAQKALDYLREELA